MIGTLGAGVYGGVPLGRCGVSCRGSGGSSRDTSGSSNRCSPSSSSSGESLVSEDAWCLVIFFFCDLDALPYCRLVVFNVVT